MFFCSQAVPLSYAIVCRDQLVLEQPPHISHTETSGSRRQAQHKGVTRSTAVQASARGVIKSGQPPQPSETEFLRS